MRFGRCAAMAALVLGAVVTTAVPAWAAAPDNDSYAGRTVIGSLPFSQTLDTSEATTESEDAAVNAGCGYPATDASVWYEVTAPVTGTLVINVWQSGYSAGAVVATGSPGNWTVEGGCISGYGTPTVVAGRTYTILVFDDQWDGGGNGGILNIGLDWGPPPPTIDIAVNPSGSVDSRSGEATVSGTATCTNAAWASVYLDLRQPLGRLLTISGSGYVNLVCDGASHIWTVEVYPYSGKFAGGKAVVNAYGGACGPLECRSDSDQRTIQLR
jgi:hypothetical protein